MAETCQQPKRTASGMLTNLPAIACEGSQPHCSAGRWCACGAACCSCCTHSSLKCAVILILAAESSVLFMMDCTGLAFFWTWIKMASRPAQELLATEQLPQQRLNDRPWISATCWVIPASIRKIPVLCTSVGCFVQCMQQRWQRRQQPGAGAQAAAIGGGGAGCIAACWELGDSTAV